MISGISRSIKLAILGLFSFTLTVPVFAAEPIKVGMSVSSTGNFALASQSGERGIEVWVDDVNSRGGIDVGGEKRLVELVKLDDRSDKQQVAKVYESLIADNDVDVVVAPFGSTLTGVAATVTERLDRFMVIWSAASESVYSQGFTRIVSATQMPVSVMPKAGIELASNLGIKKLAISYVDEPFPAGLAKAGQELAEEHGIEVVMYEKYAKGAKDFSTMLEKARILDADGYYPTSYEADMIAMVRQMKELDINFPFTYMTYASQPQFLEIGEDADYLFSHTNFHEAVQWDVNSGLNREQFLETYNRLFPDVTYEPDFQTALAYGAGAILEEIIAKAGTTDAENLKNAAMELSGNLTVLAGPYEIDDAGRQLGMPFVMVQNLPDEGVQAVYPDEVATAEPVYPIPAWSDR